jgi:molybdate transport system substrate-binding protein
MNFSQRWHFAAIALLISLFLQSPTLAAVKTKIFVAASLSSVMKEIGEQWKAKTGSEILVVSAASSALAKQIAAGAPADVFISADLAWMDDLAAKKLIKEKSRKNLLSNSLVVIGPSDSKVLLNVLSVTTLKAAVSSGKLALANVKAVPAGRYAKEALVALGAWGAIADSVVQSENVRAALALVARGEVSIGIDYYSDAVSEPKVKVLATIPANLHQRILYPVAITNNATSGEAEAFVQFLQSDTSTKIFAKSGFVTLTN